MKRCAFLIFCTLLTLPAMCQEQQMVIIKGTLSGDLKGFNKMYLYTRTTNDSAKIDAGHYTFTFPFDGPHLRFLYPEYIKAQGQMYSPYGILIAMPGVYHVTSDIDDGMHASKLNGPEPLLLYNHFQNDYKKHYEALNRKLQDMYGNDWWQADEKSPLYDKINQSKDSLKRALLLPLLKNLVSENPGSMATAYILNGVGKDIGNITDKEQLYQSLIGPAAESSAAKDYYDYIQGLKNGRVGESVADFSLPDPAGNPIDFKNFSGKYLLIDFWASWCWPCRNSFPHMREIYKKFRNQMEIYSISIDESKSDWLKAVQEEKNPWPQALDTENISQRSFAVTAVPSTFLISPDGKILEKEVGFDPDGNGRIEKMIHSLFVGNNNQAPQINQQNNKQP